MENNKFELKNDIAKPRKKRTARQAVKSFLKLNKRIELPPK